MIAGAAVQRDSRAIKSAIRGQVKVSCFVCGAWYCASAHQIREGALSCRCGAGPMLVANMAACEALMPDRLHEHPDYVEDGALAGRSELRAVDRARNEGKWGSCDAPDHCVSCGWRRPDRADRDVWHCPKCRRVNDHGAEFKASPFGRDAEYARGLAAPMPF